MKALKIGSVLIVLVLTTINLSAQQKSVYHKDGHTTTVTHFYEDGTVKETGSYYKGILHGEWIKYHPTGKVNLEANYDNGDKEGKWLTYSADGMELIEVLYSDNALVSVDKWKLEETNLLADR